MLLIVLIIVVIVSIHAPLAGCDFERVFFLRYIDSFNPRTPRGVRPPYRGKEENTMKFQSTHPSRGATFLRLA